MMIAVAIAGSLVVYAWIMGYIGFSTERAGEAITIPSIANDPTDSDLLVYVQNIGEKSVQLEESECLYIDGVLVECTITGVTVSDRLATLDKGETAMLRYSGGAVLLGVKVKVKVTTLLGTFAEKSAYPAGSTRALPVLDHFEFNTITSPQTSGVPFDVTIRAVDQYGNLFTGYSGTIVMRFLDGDELLRQVHYVGEMFISGVWDVNLSFIGSATDATISVAAQSDLSKNGTSNTFYVIGWLEGWNYRQSHVVECSEAGFLTDYPMKIIVERRSGSSNGNTIYVDTDCTPDFSDIRFTDYSETIVLDYWLESVDGTAATFWVEVPVIIPASPSRNIIYVYYGNSGAPYIGDGEATFTFFDDFEDGSIDTNKWDIEQGTPTESDGQLHAKGSATEEERDVIYSDSTFDINHAVVAQVATGTHFGHIPNIRNRLPYSTDALTAYPSGSYWVFNTRNDASNTQTLETGADSDWHVWEIRWTADRGELINTDGSEWDVVHTENVPTSADSLHVSLIGGSSTGNDSDVEFVLVRKYVYPEPSHGDWGEEEIWLSG